MSVATTMAPEITIAVMGATGSGKTTFVNLASGSALNVGSGLQSCTSAIHVTDSFSLDGRQVRLIDTPGFDDTSKSDVDILHTIAQYLATAYQQGKTLAGVIYIHRISDTRMSGISRRNFKMFRQLCGESTLKNVIIMTNMWGVVSEQIGREREAELAREDLFFKPTLDAGAQMLRHYNTHDSAHNILRYIVNNHPMPLQIQQEIVDEHKAITDTAAAEELQEELLKEQEKHRQEMLRVQQEMERSIRLQEEENKRRIAQEAERRRQELQAIEEQARQQALALQLQRQETERQLQAAAAQARWQAQQQAEQHRRHLEELERQRREARAQAEREAEELRRRAQQLRWQREEEERRRNSCNIQ